MYFLWVLSCYDGTGEYLWPRTIWPSKCFLFGLLQRNFFGCPPPPPKSGMEFCIDDQREKWDLKAKWSRGGVVLNVYLRGHLPTLLMSWKSKNYPGLKEWKSAQTEKAKSTLHYSDSENKTDKASCNLNRKCCFTQEIIAIVKCYNSSLSDWALLFLPVMLLTHFAIFIYYWGYWLAKSLSF